MKILDIFFEEKGKPGLKRICGSLLLLNGAAGKNYLCYYALKHPTINFERIDACFEGLIYSGLFLLVGTIVDKIFKKKNVENSTNS